MRKRMKVDQYEDMDLRLEGWGFDVDALRESEGALSSLDRRSPRAISTNLTEEEWCSYAGMPSPSAYID